jgi:hypothetical protein
MFFLPKDKGLKPWSLRKNSGLSEIWQLWIEKCLQFSVSVPCLLKVTFCCAVKALDAARNPVFICRLSNIRISVSSDFRQSVQQISGYLDDYAPIARF